MTQLAHTSEPPMGRKRHSILMVYRWREIGGTTMHVCELGSNDPRLRIG